MAYIMQLLEPVVKSQASSFEVTHEATDDWNTRIQQKLSNSVWSSCRSWYRTGGTGKNTALWPGPLIEQWWLLRSPEWKHYKAVGAQKWARRRMLQRVWRTVTVGGLVAALVWGYWYPDEASQIVRQAKELVVSVWSS